MIQVLYLIDVLIESNSEWHLDLEPLIFIIQLYHLHPLELIVRLLFRPLLRDLVMYCLKIPGLFLDQGPKQSEPIFHPIKPLDIEFFEL
jgi:hypothetical protein